MKVVGLTGGIATGKSTVGRMLTDLGVPVLDADQAARQVVEPGQPALAAIVEAFGSEVLQADGSLDRAALRDRITRDAEARATLEGITHPAIRTSIALHLGELAQQGHADVHASVEHVLDELEVARLEHVERQDHPREEHHVGQGEDRQGAEDFRRRYAIAIEHAERA